MTLDILTPKGQQTLAQERRAIQLFEKKHVGYNFIETAKDRPAEVDGLIECVGVIVSVVEVKCRQMTHHHFAHTFNNQWLVTASKLLSACSVAKGLCCDFHGFLYLVQSDVLLVKKLWGWREQRWLTPITFDETETQQTVNGGKIVRCNAFINMDGARELT